MKFHDGTDLTVEDVIFTIKTVMEDQTNSALREDFSLVDKVEKVDGATLKITLKEPFPALLDKLTIGIVPAHCFKEGEDINTAAFNQNPVGCGPYRFVSYEADSKLVLTRFDDYYGHKPRSRTSSSPTCPTTTSGPSSFPPARWTWPTWSPARWRS